MTLYFFWFTTSRIQWNFDLAKCQGLLYRGFVISKTRWCGRYDCKALFCDVFKMVAQRRAKPQFLGLIKRIFLLVTTNLWKNNKSVRYIRVQLKINRSNKGQRRY